MGGEREGVVVPSFDVGASPREFAEAPRARTLILSTTNGTATILTAAARCETVLLGSLLNLDAVAEAARAAGDEVAIFCAGFKGGFALDDAYCAGRLVAELGGERSDAAIAAALVARSFPTALEGLNARTYGPPGLEADIEFCARENALDDRSALLADGRHRGRDRRLDDVGSTVNARSSAGARRAPGGSRTPPNPPDPRRGARRGASGPLRARAGSRRLRGRPAWAARWSAVTPSPCVRPAEGRALVRIGAELDERADRVDAAVRRGPEERGAAIRVALDPRAELDQEASASTRSAFAAQTSASSSTSCGSSDGCQAGKPPCGR